MISLQLTKEESEKLVKYVYSNKLGLPVKSEYEYVRIKTAGQPMILYKSNKLVHEPSDESKLILDRILQSKAEYEITIGTDEVGKGEWYGPLVVVGTAMTVKEIDDVRRSGIADSKTLSKSKILELGELTLRMNIKRKSRIFTPEKYNEKYSEFWQEGKTLNDMMAWAHAEIVKDLIEEYKDRKIRVVIDKFDFQKTNSRLFDKKRERVVDASQVNVVQISRGETEIPVATASVIAKSIFEKEVDALEDKYKVTLRNTDPCEISKDILPHVSKLHFKNVSNCFEQSK